jgi:hypothetical protein
MQRLGYSPYLKKKKVERTKRSKKETDQASPVERGGDDDDDFVRMIADEKRSWKDDSKPARILGLLRVWNTWDMYFFFC